MSNTRDDSPPTPEDRALRQQFLLGMSHAACTVNVVTTDGVAGRHGVTVSAMVSVSADTPQPTLLVCIHHLSPVVAAVLENGVFCVNVLRDDQAHISDNFAGRSGAQGAAKFDCADVDDAGDRCAARGRFAGGIRLPRHGERTGGIALRGVRLCAGHLRGRHGRTLDLCQSRLRSAAAISSAALARGVPRRAPSPSAATRCSRLTSCPALVARLTKLHPDIALTLIESDQEHLIASLRRSDTEIALLYDFGLGEDLHVERLAELTPYVLLARGPSVACRVRDCTGRN